MFKYYKMFWQRYVDFTGRSRRSEFWYTMLAHAIIYLPFYIAMFAVSIRMVARAMMENWETFDVFYSNFGVLMIFGGLIWLYWLATIIPNLAITVRRLHDTGKEWVWILVSLIPYAGPIWLLVLMCMDDQPGENAWGPNPKAQAADLGEGIDE